MDEIAIARALHVFAVVLWIGGVSFVTTVLLPAVRRFKSPEERLTFFDAIGRLEKFPLSTVTQIRFKPRRL
jgi:uncharacterized membrane protein